MVADCNIRFRHKRTDAVVAVEGLLGDVLAVRVALHHGLEPGLAQVLQLQPAHDPERLGLEARAQGAVLVEELGLDGQARAVRHVDGLLVHLLADGRGGHREGADVVLLGMGCGGVGVA